MSGKEQTVLVFGATGMLGHKLVQRLSPDFPVVATVRTDHIPDTAAARFALGGAHLLFGVNVERDEDIDRAFEIAKPAVVINAVGFVKQLKEANDPITSITINSLLPHRISARCRAGITARFIHFSTDCVFSGRNGPYRESDTPDADDLYGRSKLLGETVGYNCLTIRSSIIGRELSRGTGLLEWFLSQRGKRVKGFAHALYSGITTEAMASLVGWIIREHPNIEGLWQVAGPSISKLDLLRIFDRRYRTGVEIDVDELFRCDRRLNGDRFAAATGFVPSDWDTMIADLQADPTPY
jgi:dTDP-4-dehydrorhamnose reductase